MYMLGIYLFTKWTIVGTLICMVGGLLVGTSSYFFYYTESYKKSPQIRFWKRAGISEVALYKCVIRSAQNHLQNLLIFMNRAAG